MPTSVRSLYPLVLLTLAWPAVAVGADWRPIAPAELVLASPKVQADADTEALLWEVRVADRVDVDYEATFTTTFEHYLRIKIFTDRGRDALATVDIPFVSGVRIRDVAARTTRPDGSSLELKKADIYERMVVKADDLKIKAVSFAVPGIQRGAIVEYRWSEVHDDSLAMNLTLPFSRDIPVHQVRYYLEPLQLGRQFALRTMPFNGQFTGPERQKDGSWMVSLAQVAADRAEPYATPVLERQPWLFVFYVERSAPTGKAMWQQFSKDLHNEYTRRTRPNEDIRRIATEAVRGASTTAERIQALVGAVRGKVRRIDVDTASAEERRKAKENKNAADALKRGAGSGNDVLLLFLALANAAGMEARVAASPDRSRLFHSPSHDHYAFLQGRLAVVREGDRWIPVDPANEYNAVGGLRWFYEKLELLIADPQGVVSVTSTLTPPAGSRKRRVGTFKLTEDGTLEGECRLEFTGHWAEIFREQDDDEPIAEREKSFKAQIVRRLPGAEVTEVKVDPASDLSMPYVNSYKVRIPGYAQRTGARLFFQPSVFQKGIDAVFPGETRTSPVYFEFPWSEEDQVSIELPAGFTLEQPRRPAPLDAGAATFDVWLGTEDAWRHLVLKRSLAVGLKDVTQIPGTGYRAVRGFFTAVHESDAHTLVLRREGEK